MSKMINCTIGNNISRSTKILASDTTLRAALEGAGIDYSIGMTSLDGSTLKPGDLDKTFDDFGINDRCYLLNVAKMDNAAVIKVAGKAVVLESDFTVQDLKLVEKHRPKAMSLFEDKEEVFKVMTGTGAGSVSEYGVVFGSAPAEDAKATITMLVPDGTADIKAWIMNQVSTAILDLKKVEAQLPAVIAEINDELAAIESSITIM